MTYTSWVGVWGSLGLLVACGGEFTAADLGSSTGTSGDTATTSGSSAVGSTGSGSATTSSGGGGDAIDTSASSSVSATATSTGSGGSGSGGSNATSVGAGGAGKSGSGGASAGGAGGSAGRAGSGGSGGSGSIDAGADVGRETGPGETGTSDVVSDPCPALRANVAAKLAAARACNPNSPDKLCQTTVQDLCCPYPVAAPDSVATNEYRVALAKFHEAQCTWACTATLCPTGQGSCVMSQGSPTGFTCAFTLATGP